MDIVEGIMRVLVTDYQYAIVFLCRNISSSSLDYRCPPSDELVMLITRQPTTGSSSGMTFSRNDLHNYIGSVVNEVCMSRSTMVVNADIQTTGVPWSLS